MDTVPIETLDARIAELAHRVEQGETVVITRGGKPLLDLVPHAASQSTDAAGTETGKKGGLDFEAFAAYKKARGIDRVVTYIAPDFDDPLPEDFLLQPLPEQIDHKGPK